MPFVLATSSVLSSAASLCPLTSAARSAQGESHSSTETAEGVTTPELALTEGPIAGEMSHELGLQLI